MAVDGVKTLNNSLLTVVVEPRLAFASCAVSKRKKKSVCLSVLF
jgi:hypothetical protein